MMLFALAACGGEESNAKENDNASKGNEAQATGETYEVGAFSVYVPSGWKAFPVMDMFAEDTNTVDPEIIQICKGGETEFDIYTKPYIRLNYYGPETTMMRDKSFYDDVVDLEPIVAGEYTWDAFSCTSLGYKMTILWLTDGDYDYQAVVYTDTDGGTVSVTDADVLEILASVTPN